jgi:hypothetical protein
MPVLSTASMRQSCGSGSDAEYVDFDDLGHPVLLLGCCHHFNDAERN